MMNRKSFLLGCLFVTVVVAGMLCVGELQQLQRMMSAPDSDTSVLAGLNGVFVRVHLHYEKNYTNVDAVAYKASIENRLKARGITVLSADDVSKNYRSDNPAAHLVVLVTVRQVESDDGETSEPPLMYTTSVEVREQASLVRAPSPLVSEARVWNCQDFGLVPEATKCGELCKTASDCIDSFIKEYVQVN